MNYQSEVKANDGFKKKRATCGDRVGRRALEASRGGRRRRGGGGGLGTERRRRG